MKSKPLLLKNQALPISIKKLRFQSQMRHELLLTLEASNHQIIKRKKTFTCVCGSEAANESCDLPSQSLTQTMKSNRNVQRFQLFYKENLQRSDQGLSSIFQALNDLPYLKTLSLSFEDAEGLYQLGKQLSRLVHLRKLRLSFRNCRSITDQELHCLTQSIRKLFLIEELDLRFMDIHTTDKDLCDIRQCVKSLSRLKKFALCFDSRQITDAGVYEIHRDLKNLVCLESLRLEFIQTFMTDNGIQHIGQSLKSLTGIKSIQLYCYFSPEITDTTLFTLGEDLKGLDTVQNIDLTVYQCSITDKGIDDFSKNLKELVSLERLSLDFSYNHQITDQGLELLGLNLKEVVSLKEVFLQFVACPEASEDGRKKLLKSLKKHVKVQFDGCERPTKKQRKRNKLIVIPIALGLIGLSLAQIVRSLLSLGNGSFSWIPFLLNLFGLALSSFLVWALTGDK